MADLKKDMNLKVRGSKTNSCYFLFFRFYIDFICKAVVPHHYVNRVKWHDKGT